MEDNIDTQNKMDFDLDIKEFLNKKNNSNANENDNFEKIVDIKNNDSIDKNKQNSATDNVVNFNKIIDEKKNEKSNNEFAKSAIAKIEKPEKIVENNYENNIANKNKSTTSEVIKSNKIEKKIKKLDDKKQKLINKKNNKGKNQEKKEKDDDISINQTKKINEKSNKQKSSKIKTKKDKSNIAKEQIKQENNDRRKTNKIKGKEKREIKENNIQQKKKELEEKKRKKIIEKYENRTFRINNLESYFELDNAATIYPSVISEEWSAGYRVSAILKQDVNPFVLQQALEKTLLRFPFYNVTIKKGFFWYYFQRLSNFPQVLQEKEYPCSSFDFRGDRHIFRVLYYKNKISYEGFHAIGDGYGAVVFINTLLTNYFKMLGIDVEYGDYPIDANDMPYIEEKEDSFIKYADLKEANPRSESKAFQIKGTRLESGQCRVVTGIMDLNQLKQIAKANNCNINEFLSANLLFALNNFKKQTKISKLPVKISLTVDLRKFFESYTMRNFSSYKNIAVDDVDAKFEDILDIVKKDLKAIDRDYLMKNVNANVLAQKNFFVRAMPLFLKDPVLKACFHSFGEKLWTMAFSNLGIIKTPECFKDLVDRYELIIGPGLVNGSNATVCTYNNKVVFTFSRINKEAEFEKIFWRQLTKLGIKVYIESNY